MQHPEFPRWLQWALFVVAGLLIFQAWIIPAKLLGLELTTNVFALGFVVTFIAGCAIAETVRHHSRLEYKPPEPPILSNRSRWF